ncbi:MAG TPA: FtsX-like permease family protein [Terriglobales bacterium]|jgi:putative ABC transport system permease protein|nr:FtsX-like permease family protein [Terriglobales bacterium]
MKTYDLSELALRNLRESSLRNSLTTIGISVGVASLVAMLSLGIGLQQLANRHLVKSGLFDTVVVMSRRDVRGFSRDDEKNNSSATAAESRTLDEPARQEIERLAEVQEAYPDIRFITELRYQDKPHLTMVAGIPESARSNDAFSGVQGRFFSSESAPEVILQESFAAELLGKTEKPGQEDDIPVAELAQPLIGQELTMRYAERIPAASSIPEGAATKAASPTRQVPAEAASDAAYSVVSREQKLKIVGVSDLDPDSMRGAARARVFLPLKLAENLHVMQPSDLRDSMRGFSKQPSYSTISVRVKNPKQVEAVEQAIKKMGFNTFSILDATRSLRQFFTVLDLFLGIFGSLALAVASIGIVNTLVMAILERRREIGIMKAIGASDGDVKKLFFAEAGAMGVLGGIVGVALGWTIGHVINLGTNIYLKRQALPPENFWSVPWWLVGAAIVFAFVVSLLSGLYPAARAARLDPVQALRYE